MVEAGTWGLQHGFVLWELGLCHCISVTNLKTILFPGLISLLSFLFKKKKKVERIFHSNQASKVLMVLCLCCIIQFSMGLTRPEVIITELEGPWPAS